jgi:hypothetical protein
VSKDQYRTLSLTPEGREVMLGRRSEFRVRRPTWLPRLPAPLRDSIEDDDDLEWLLRRRQRW